MDIDTQKLEQLQKAIADIVKDQKAMAKRVGMPERHIDDGIQIINRTLDFAVAISKLAESMKVSVPQFQDAVTFLAILGGISPDLRNPHIMDFYSLLFQERMLREKAGPTANVPSANA